MWKRYLLFLLTATVALLPFAPAAEFAEVRFPKGFGISFSIRSTAEFVQSIDDFAVACVEGTNEAISPGHVARKIFMGIPALEAMDVEAHLFLPQSFSYATLMNHLIVLGNTDVEELAGLFGAMGITVEKNENSNYYNLRGRGRSPFAYFLNDMGDGYVAIAPNPNALGMISREMDRGWRPALWFEGVAGIMADQPGKWMATADNLSALAGLAGMYLADGRNREKLEKVDVAVLMRLLDVVGEAIADLDDELRSLKRIGYEYHVNRDRAAVALRSLSDKDSFLGRAGLAMSAAEPLDNDLIRKAGENAFFVGAFAAPEAIAPGMLDVAADVAERLGNGAFPELKDAIMAAVERHAEAGPGERAGIMDFGDTFLSANFYVRADDPEKMMQALADAAVINGNVLREIFPELPADGPVVMVTEGKTAAGKPFKRIEWDKTFIEAYSDVFSGGKGFRANMPQDLEKFLNMGYAVVMAAGEEFVVTMPGELDEARLAAALAPGTASRPFVDTEAARATLNELESRQGGVMLFDFNRFFLGLIDALGRHAGKDGVKTQEEVDEMLHTLKSNLASADIMSGLALGGRDGCVVLTMVVPSAVVRTMLHNVDAMVSSLPTRSGQGTIMGHTDMRRRANEASAVTMLRSYAVAQLTFQISRQGRNEENTGTGRTGYADNFRNLYYGMSAGGAPGPLELVNKAMADAHAGPTRGLATVTRAEQPAMEAVPYEGYLFLEPDGVDFTETFNLVAYPIRFGQTGTRIFCIDEEGDVYIMRLEKRQGGMPKEGEMPPLVTSEETLAANPDLWEIL